jgi:membrane protease YdiL (CAAX protease family)
VITERAPRWPAGSYARLGHALGCVVLQALTNAVAFVAIVPLLLHADDPPFEGTPMEFVVVVLMGAMGGGAVVGLALCTLGRIRLADLGWLTRFPGRDFAWGVLGFVACAAIVVALQGVDGGMAGARTAIASISSYSAAQRVLFFAMGATAAFCEESIFRGYLQPALVAKVGRYGGVVATAAIFALYHLRFRPVSLVALFAMGLIYGALRARRGGLFAPAAAHGLVWAVLGSA